MSLKLREVLERNDREARAAQEARPAVAPRPPVPGQHSLVEERDGHQACAGGKSMCTMTPAGPAGIPKRRHILEMGPQLLGSTAAASVPRGAGASLNHKTCLDCRLRDGDPSSLGRVLPYWRTEGQAGSCFRRFSSAVMLYPDTSIPSSGVNGSLGAHRATPLRFLSPRAKG